MTFAIIGSERAPGILDGRPVVVPSAVSSKTAETEFLRVLARNRMLLGPRLDFHYVPGRLRLRAAGLKADSAKLETFCAELTSVPGVHSVTPRPATGSIVIEYDPSVLPPDGLSAALHEYGLAAPGDCGGFFPSLADQIASKTVERLVEKLAVALIAAVV
jgi:heavy-metal-associated domain-containing protein